ncbi:MAG: hypothetical protein H0X16_03255 [Chloroflexi bacterium]|nr:hypothetical protein [Chloroflexota bacterium]
MRVRLFELRLLAITLVTLWVVAGLAILTGYRPGGPVDLIVAAAAFLPPAAAALAVIWPPLARGDRAAAAVGWLGIASAVLLLPSIGSIVRNLAAGGRQTILPSAEVAYALMLALAATCLFSGLGVARAVLGQTALRWRRLVLGTLIAVTATSLTAAAFGGAALANELALRDAPPPQASRWGPTDLTLEPRDCDGPLRAGRGARVDLDASGRVDDGTAVGTVTLEGVRSGTDERWTASRATHRDAGQTQYVRVGERGWLYEVEHGWRSIPESRQLPGTLDTAVINAALSEADRAAAEDVGVELVGDARARHCRRAIDGPTALAAFPALRWFLSQNPLDTEPALRVWRGSLDWWVFADGELGMAAVEISGPTFSGEWPGRGLQVTLQAQLTALDRSSETVIEPPPR